MNINILHNKVILINIAIVATVLTVIIILNTPTMIDYEELATIPYDYTPDPFVKGWIPKQITVEVKHPELFIVDHAVYISTNIYDDTTNTVTTEYQPYPMSSASSILICDSIHTNDTVLILAIKKSDTTPAVYAVVLDDGIRCYFSDPFPTGYNSLLIFIKADTNIDNIRVEIRKIRELG